MLQLALSKFPYSNTESTLSQHFCKLSYMETIGKRIRSRRKELKLTQDDIAKRVTGLSRVSVSQWGNDIKAPKDGSLAYRGLRVFVHSVDNPGSPDPLKGVNPPEDPPLPGDK